VKAFQKAGSLAPGDIGLQTRLAGARMSAGQAETALDDLEHTLQLAPTVPQVGEALFFAALATGDLNKAAEAVGKVRRAQGATPVEQNLEGLLKLAQLDQPSAAEKFKEIIRNNPDFAPAQVNLARVLAMQGRSTEAEQLLSALLQKQPAAEPALTMLASQYVQTGRVATAITLLEQAHGTDRGNTRLTARLGELYVRAGKPADALAMVNKENNVQNSADLLNLKAAAQLALNQKDQAQDTYGQILRLDPLALPTRRARRIISLTTGIAELQWCANRPRTSQVSTIAYLTGGSLLSLAYWDYYFTLLVAVAAVHRHVKVAPGHSDRVHGRPTRTPRPELALTQ
jgi:tetratricopeptide (TPR) repeat protein